MTVVRSGPPQVKVNVPQQVGGVMKTGDAATVSYRVGDGLLKADGEIKLLAPVVDAGSATRVVIVQVNADHPDLLPGMFATVWFVQSK